MRALSGSGVAKLINPFKAHPTSARGATNLGTEVQLTARMGIPLALGEMGWMSTYIVDALMIGRLPHSALSIAASSLGNTIFYAIAFCAIGLLTGLQTVTAQAFGRGDEADCHRALVQAIWIDAALTPLAMVATLASIPMLRFFHTPPDIIAETNSYLQALVWSTAPLLLYWTLRRYLQSLDRISFVVISLLCGGVVNFVADWAFLYGHLGLTPSGIKGSAWATCVVRLFGLVFLLWALPQGFWAAARGNILATFRPQAARVRLLLGIGWPSAIESLADLGVSTYMSVLCAQLGVILLAAHQIVLDLDAFVYMAPLGLSYATAVRVGQGAGRNDVSQARRYASAGLILGLGYIGVAGSLFIRFGLHFASFYTTDASVIAAAAPIFLLCGFLQLGDAAGVILAGALIGVGDTRAPLIINAIWSWGIGMPVAYALSFHYGLSLKGLWLGRVLAAVGSSVTLAMAWRLRLRRRRLSIDSLCYSSNVPSTCSPPPGNHA